MFLVLSFIILIIFIQQKISLINTHGWEQKNTTFFAILVYSVPTARFREEGTRASDGSAAQSPNNKNVEERQRVKYKFKGNSRQRKILSSKCPKWTGKKSFCMIREDVAKKKRKKKKDLLPSSFVNIFLAPDSMQQLCSVMFHTRT